MKKIISVLIFLLLIFSFYGCNSEKTEAVSKSEIVEDVELTTEDLDMVFDEFIAEKYPDFTREDFDIWNKTYLDINGNGKNEVVFSTDYSDGKLNKAIVLSADDGEYKEISKFIYLAKYLNEFEVKDGFLIHRTKVGGSGIFDFYMDVYGFDGDSLYEVGSSILTESFVGMPQESYEIKSEINGSLADFVITYFKTDLTNENAEPEMIAKDHYYIDDFHGDRYAKLPLSIGDSGKDFNQVYDGVNLSEVLNYFNKNIYFLSEERQINFANTILETLRQDYVNFKPQGDFLQLNEEDLNKETLEYDISNLDDKVKKDLKTINGRGIYFLTKQFYATEGTVEEYDGFNIVVTQWSGKSIDMAINLSDLEFAEEIGFDILNGYYSSDMTTIEEVISNPYMSNIVIVDYNSIENFKDEDTWKLNLFLPLTINGVF